MSAYRKTKAIYSSKIPRRDDRVKWAYLAGLIDGDGTIHIQFHPDRNYRNVMLGVGNTDRGIIEYLKNTFGGTVDKGYTTKGNKIFRCWTINGSRVCKIFLIRLRPYLIIKKKQAEITLKFIDTFIADKPRYKTRPGYVRVIVTKNNELWSEREEQRKSLALQNMILNKGDIIHA